MGPVLDLAKQRDRDTLVMAVCWKLRHEHGFVERIKAMAGSLASCVGDDLVCLAQLAGLGACALRGLCNSARCSLLGLADGVDCGATDPGHVAFEKSVPGHRHHGRRGSSVSRSSRSLPRLPSYLCWAWRCSLGDAPSPPILLQTFALTPPCLPPIPPASSPRMPLTPRTRSSSSPWRESPASSRASPLPLWWFRFSRRIVPPPRPENNCFGCPAGRGSAGRFPSGRAVMKRGCKLEGKLIFDLIALNSLIEFASAESANFRLQANRARRLLEHIFSLISARRSLDAHLERSGWPEDTEASMFFTKSSSIFSERCRSNWSGGKSMN